MLGIVRECESCGIYQTACKILDNPRVADVLSQLGGKGLED